MQMFMGRLAIVLLIVGLMGCTPEGSELTPDQVFIKYYGGSSIDEAADFVVNNNGEQGLDYVILGSSSSEELIGANAANGNKDFVLLFADQDGNRSDLTQRSFFPDTLAVSQNSAIRIRKTSDGGYILAGTSIYGGQDDMFVVKTDANGVEEGQWYNRTATTEAINDVVEVQDGFLLVGSVGAGNNKRILVVKLPLVFNSGSDAVWEYVSTNIGLEEEGVSAVSLYNGSRALVVANSRQPRIITGTPNGNLRLLEFVANTNEVPNAITGELYGLETFNEQAVRMRKISDTDVYITGDASPVNSSDLRPFFMRITGVTFSTVNYVRYDDLATADMLAGDINRTSDGGYLMLATGVSDLSNGQQMMLLRLDAFGALDAAFGGDQPFIQFGADGNEEGVAVAQLPDGGIGILGTVGFDGNANSVIGLIKTNGNGILGK